MSLDAFSVFVAFLAIVEAALGAVAIAVALRELRGGGADADDARRPLAALVAGTLLVVAVTSIPLFQLLLASWVPRWPGVMCVEGVRRIGTGSLGAAGWLPSLVSFLDVSKPLLVFAAGAWLILRRIPRPRVAKAAALAAVVLGLAALADSAAAAAYVAIPKEEIAPASGCCMVSGIAAAREAGLTPEGASDVGTLTPLAFVAASALLGLAAAALRIPSFASAGRAGLVAAAAAATVPLAAGFLADVAAPTVLDLPFHHCVWCALARAPETAVGAVLCLGASLSAGWAFVAQAAGAPAGEGAPRRLLALAAIGFLGTAAMASVIAWVL